MPIDPNRDATLFNAALALSPAERAAFLAAECGDDAALRARVERLLAAHDDLGDPDTSDAPPDPPTATFGADDGGITSDLPGRDEFVGAVLGGKYKLVEEIGEGGMGSVFMAQQTEPVKRAVAVKVIKAGMDSKAVLARFEAERQALAMMDHPNIARVLDAGTTESGRPYFVMELVKGVPITQYCDERKLTPRQRLELFVPVCNAIQHAHQKGVIHRDIKPNNVLVALYDDRPVPKVIDFGVAKAAGQTLTDKTLMTGFGAVVGTPEYMSPEQASLNNLDIYTRSDVYSLGVLLYELLTGTTPVDRKSLGKAALLEILRIVREVEAPRPSAKLSTIDTLPSVAANRGTEPARLSRLLKGELDWVLLKALEKDRARRYDSATALAKDVERHLRGDAVEACPPTLGYRLKKFLRKNRTAMRVATAFVSLGLGAIAMGAYLAVQATRAERAAEQRRIEAEENANRAEANAKQAEEYLVTLRGANFRGRELIQELALKSASLQVDLDLTELKTDPRVGLLRLARTRKQSVFEEIDEPFQKVQRQQLREFVTAAVLATCQNYAPLLPPITHDGGELMDWQLASTGRRLITLGKDGTVRLWDTATAKPIAVLRRAEERVFNCGLSPDGKTAYTDGLDGVVRLWETSDGAYRAETEPRLGHVYGNGVGHWGSERGVRYRGVRGCWYDGRDVTRISNDRLLTCSVPKLPAPRGFSGPVELWDTKTGKRVAVLEDKGRAVETFRFTDDGRWLSAANGTHTTSIFNAQDGRNVAELKHAPDHVAVGGFYPSPGGESFATVGRTNDRFHVYHWTSGTWQLSRLTGPCQGRSWPDDEAYGFMNLDSETFAFNRWTGDGFDSPSSPLSVYRVGGNVPLNDHPERTIRARTSDGSSVLLDDGSIVSTRTWKREIVPAGRKYATDMIRFAQDQRFVLLEDDWFIDSRTEKEFLTSLREGFFSEITKWAYYPEFGWCAATGAPDVTIRRLPPADQLNLPPALLQLWSQVAVRGELGPEGTFVKWDESTWEKKRQELAAIPPPHPNFPFPGYVATDRLHWLRAEYLAAAEADKPRRANELLRRAEAIGDSAEAARWRAECAKYVREVAPLPREVVK